MQGRLFLHTRVHARDVLITRSMFIYSTEAIMNKVEISQDFTR